MVRIHWEEVTNSAKYAKCGRAGIMEEEETILEELSA
jgi:hypothetical protein